VVYPWSVGSKFPKLGGKTAKTENNKGGKGAANKPPKKKTMIEKHGTWKGGGGLCEKRRLTPSHGGPWVGGNPEKGVRMWWDRKR